MRNKVKRTLSFLLTFVMLCSLLPAMALAKEPEGRYEEVAGTEALVADAEVHVYSTKGAGDIELTGTNSIETTFTQGIGYREYTATAKEGWVFDTWEYEQLFTPAFGKEKNLGNRTDEGDGTRYSFTNSGDNWHDPYTKENATISVNRLLTTGETVFNKLYYNIYANFNPTIKATAEENGTISGSDKPVEVEYGKDQAFDIKADTGYIIDTITVDGKDIAEGKNEESYTYTFENVTAPHTIDVTFKVKPEPGKFDVTYRVEGSIPENYVVPEGERVSDGGTHTVAAVPEAVTTDEGTYTFDGWYNGEIKVGDTIEVRSNVTLTGIWTFEGKDDVWNTVYGTIRVYMDKGTKADFDALEGNLAKQVRLYSEKYLTDGYRLCGYEPINDFWYTTNSRGVTANDISKIVLAKDNAFDPSSKIEIPIKESGDYTVTVTEGTDKIGWISYSYLRIDITKNKPVEETVTLTYDANGGKGAPENAEVNKNTEYTLDSTTVPTHDAVQGMKVTFQGWSTDTEVIDRIYSSDQVPDIQSTVSVQDKDVTVYAVWTFDASQVPDVHPVQVVVYQNGNTETPVKTEIIDYVRKGDSFDIDSLNINDYYNSDYGFETIGWFNDGKWNEYKAGKNPDSLHGEITINGWTNVICMVTDKYPVHVFAVTDGDKENAEEIYTGTALKGTALIAFLDQNVTDLEKEGYTLDKWYNWDWYGHKYSEGTTVNGWTNAYVTYTSIDTNRTVHVTFTVNPEYGTFTEYGEGPVVFNIKENSGEKYLIPQISPNEGYEFTGWKIIGNAEVPDGYLPKEMTEFELANVNKQIQYNGNEGSVIIEAVFSKKPVEKTLKIHWAIDNPEGAAWKLYEGNARTETIAWADRGNTFVMPELEIKDGYKLAGWSVSGTEGQYWAPETYEFGLTGLIVEDENGGQVSITANVIKDEVSTEDKIANVYFTVNPKYGYFKEYGEGPVSFENIDADSTQQFEVPEVVAKSGYKFVGWEGKGAGEIKWDANASTFGVPGLCYFPEGSNVGRADIRAVFEKEGGGHINDYAVTVIVDGKGEVKTKDYGTVGSNDTDVIWIPDFEDSVKFTMEPADGWKIDDVLVNGKSIGAEDSYVFETEDLMDSPELKVIFEKKSSGGGGGGSHDKDDDKDKDKAPDKTPDALNGEDHFNYIVGDADGKVHPERNITRAEVASIFFRLLQDDVREKNLTDQNPFNDVFTDDWFNVAVSTMYDMDIVYGRDNNNFDPNAYITRAEFAAIAARFDSEGYSGENLFTDIDGHWAANQINRAAEKGWISGYPDGTFGPDRYITRAEAVTMINRVLNRLPESADALHEDMNVFPDNMDTTAWYYLAIQEATSSHEYEKDKDGVYETWTDVLPDRDWAQYLKLN